MPINRKLLLLLIFLSTFVLLISPDSAPPENPWKPQNELSNPKQAALKVFFVGNSHLYVNDVPHLVAQLASSAGTPIWYDGHLIPGAQLSQHINAGVVDTMNKSGNWDVVVLQERSIYPAAAPDEFRFWYRRLADEVAKAGAKPMLYATWARHPEFDHEGFWSMPFADHSYLTFSASLEDSYSDAARNPHEIIPVSQAWRSYYNKSKGAYLHSSDGNHAALEGSFLAALVTYGRLFNDPSLTNVAFAPDGISAEDNQQLHEAAREALQGLSPSASKDSYVTHEPQANVQTTNIAATPSLFGSLFRAVFNNQATNSKTPFFEQHPSLKKSTDIAKQIRQMQANGQDTAILEAEAMKSLSHYLSSTEDFEFLYSKEARALKFATFEKALMRAMHDALASGNPNPTLMVHAATFLQLKHQGKPGFTRKNSEQIPFLETVSLSNATPFMTRFTANTLLTSVYEGLAWNDYARSGTKHAIENAQRALHHLDQNEEFFDEAGWSLFKKEYELDWKTRKAILFEYSGDTASLEKSVAKLREIDSQHNVEDIDWQLTLDGLDTMLSIQQDKQQKALEKLKSALDMVPNDIEYASERGFPYSVWHAAYLLHRSGNTSQVVNMLENMKTSKPQLESVATWMQTYIREGRSRWGTTPHRPFMIEDEPEKYTDQQ
jgi:hypothetical protein